MRGKEFRSCQEFGRTGGAVDPGVVKAGLDCGSPSGIENEDD
jgi:hypothetical protein